MITCLSQDHVAFVEPRDPRWVEPALTREFLAGRAMFCVFLCVFAFHDPRMGPSNHVCLRSACA